MTAQLVPVPSPAVIVAHDNGHTPNETTDIVTLSTGVRVCLRPVAATLLEDVTARVPEPSVPVWHNEEKGRDEPNPADPDYQRALTAAARSRGLAAIDALILFGVELVDPVPDGWEKRLRLMERRGLLSLEGYDLGDEVDREFLFKRFVAIGNDDLVLIGRRSRLTPEDVADAASSFRGA